MTIPEKIKWVILPSLIVIGIGILEIKYPHAMQGFDDGYTGRGMAGFVALIFELFLMLTWGKIEGIILILLGMLPIVICFFPFKEKVNESENAQNLSTVVASSAFNIGKAYVKQRRCNRLDEQDNESENKKNLSNVVASSAFNVGKTYVQQRRRNRQT